MSEKRKALEAAIRGQRAKQVRKLALMETRLVCVCVSNNYHFVHLEEIFNSRYSKKPLTGLLEKISKIRERGWKDGSVMKVPHA